jgi:hypothetical protein
MQRNLRIILFGCSLLIAGLACNFSSITPDEPAAPTEAGVLFQDDFSDEDSGWDQYRDSLAITDYEDGGYRIYVNESNYDVWANPGRSFTDVSVEVQATRVGGPEENDFGVICRYQDVDNFYFFIVGSDGYYGIGMVADGVQQLVGMDAMLISQGINKGSETNTIRADCVGDRLTLYANGTILADVRDSTLRSGDVGLIAGTFDDPGADILFDNFVVRQP